MLGEGFLEKVLRWPGESHRPAATLRGFCDELLMDLLQDSHHFSSAEWAARSFSQTLPCHALLYVLSCLASNSLPFLVSKVAHFAVGGDHTHELTSRLPLSKFSIKPSLRH